MNNKSWVLFAAPLLFSCSQATHSGSAETLSASNEQVTSQAIKAGNDYHSFSNPEAITVTHLDLALTANFEEQILDGTATLDFVRQKPDAQTLILDTRALSINSVTVNGESVDYTLGEADQNFF